MSNKKNLIAHFQHDGNHPHLDYKNFELGPQFSYSQMSALIYAFTYNKSESLNLTTQQFDYLIEHCDLSIIDNDGWNSLFCALVFHKMENLNLNKKQFTYLIENSDLSQKTKFADNTLTFSFSNNINEGYQLDNQQFSTIIEKMDFCNHKSKDLLLDTLCYFTDAPECMIHFSKFWQLFDNKDFLLSFIKDNNEFERLAPLMNHHIILSYEDKINLETKISTKHNSNCSLQKI